jgi:hypothetical protein
MIRYKKTFDIITPESAEAGEFAESGFIDENCSMTFREAVELLACTTASDLPNPGTWYSTDGDTDYRTGEVEIRSYHPATERDGRYMAKAYSVARSRRNR